ncbi:hypothetical protein SAMN05428988_3716 [Chitinophaga sp. YR573]|uniref:hypothetical protein n=1 Tax=Chitinophaga sp. YR573 TaxID=1881040 RepID=UPI0008C3F8BD|nr:hypothetical protein [Chitinophaga sp. YR573]SEW26076.1 hypothetical protein SAMN05428988_3716 [Chitinophaga sp. YR573]
MKRAKLMLAAIAVIAVAGGVYASKVRTGTHVFTREAGTTTCGVLVDKLSTTTVVLNQPTTAFTYATDIAGDCPIKINLYTAP